jgi:hypothetical protein
MSTGSTGGSVQQYIQNNTRQNGMQYKAVKGETHRMLVPYRSVPVMNEDGTQKYNEDGTPMLSKEPFMVPVKIHKYTGADGRFTSTMCLQPLRDEARGYHGVCAYCQRVGDAWSIEKYRENYENTYNKPQHLDTEGLEKWTKDTKRKLMDERKISDAVEDLFLVVAKIGWDKNNRKFMFGDGGIPTYELLFYEMTSGRVAKFDEIAKSADGEFAGGEFLITYPDTGDAASIVGQSTITYVQDAKDKAKQLATLYKDLVEEINSAAAKIEMGDMDKVFRALIPKSEAEAKDEMDKAFSAWDKYKEELKSNPNAVYLEYVSAIRPQNIPLNGGNQNAGAPGWGGMYSMQNQGGFMMPGQNMQGYGAPNMGAAQQNVYGAPQQGVTQQSAPQQGAPQGVAMIGAQGQTADGQQYGGQQVGTQQFNGQQTVGSQPAGQWNNGQAVNGQQFNGQQAGTQQFNGQQPMGFNMANMDPNAMFGGNGVDGN